MPCLCPCCRHVWDGPDRIAFLDCGRPPVIVTPKGHIIVSARAFENIRAMRPETGGVPVAEFRDRTAEPGQAIWRWNQKLEPLGWHIKRISSKEAKEVYGLCELLWHEERI